MQCQIKSNLTIIIHSQHSKCLNRFKTGNTGTKEMGKDYSLIISEFLNTE